MQNFFLRVHNGLMIYLQLQDGSRYEIDLAKGELLRLACCDCGLVHDIAFAVEKNGKLGIAMSRNRRATAAKRRSKPNPEKNSARA